MNDLREEDTLQEKLIPWLKRIAITVLVLNLVIDIFLGLINWLCLG